jgi:hypothetical protein
MSKGKVRFRFMSDSLLPKLQEALNKVYGNSLIIEQSDYDEYYCTKCKERVYEQFYNHLKSMCYDCWNKED